MKTKKIKLSYLSKMKPENVIFTSISGSEDISVETGIEIIDWMKEEKNLKQQPTFKEVIKWYIAELSGNAMEILLLDDGIIKKCQFDD